MILIDTLGVSIISNNIVKLQNHLNLHANIPQNTFKRSVELGKEAWSQVKQQWDVPTPQSIRSLLKAPWHCPMEARGWLESFCCRFWIPFRVGSGMISNLRWWRHRENAALQTRKSWGKYFVLTMKEIVVCFWSGLLVIQTEHFLYFFGVTKVI